jgi:hypothetical protein
LQEKTKPKPKQKDIMPKVKTSTSEAPAEGTETKSKTKEKVAPVPHPLLVEKIQGYYTAKEAAQTYLIEMGDLISKEKISRGSVIASMMEARDITKETAESQYSRIIGILSKPKVLEDLKAGVITLAEARQKGVRNEKQSTTKKAKNDAASKQTKFDSALKNLAEASKAIGYSKQDVLRAVDAQLKSIGVK